jgi:hypothetical protein
VDERPLISPLIPTQAPALPISNNRQWFWLAAILLSAVLIWLGLSQQQQQRYTFPQKI